MICNEQMTKDKTAGFTMLELVAVLVLLGIISAMVVPKFFDLQGVSEEKAAKAALAEAQVRINAGYSKAVYAGKSCTDAVATVNTIGKIADKPKDSDGGSYAIGQFTILSPSKDTEFSVKGTSVTIQLLGGTNTYSGTLTVPSCESESSSSSESGLVCPDSSSKPNLCLGSFETKCNGTVTCTCTETGMTCTCSSGGSSSDEDKDEIVKPGNDAIYSLKPFDWDMDYGKYSWIGFKLGSLIQSDGEFYVVAKPNTALQKADLIANIELSPAFTQGDIIKLDLSRNNRAQYDETDSSKPWKVWSNNKNAWQNTTGIKAKSVVYYNKSVYVARNTITGGWAPSNDSWDWIRVTNFDLFGYGNIQ